MENVRLGLALGSGAARGWSHIGVLHGLRELDIHPDLICGCSVGALVGGAYLTGHLKDLEDWLHGLDWKQVARFFDLTMSRGGMIVGKRFTDFLRDITENQRFDELPLPFAVVAADLMTGQEVCLDEGSLADALRASASLPGLFAPYNIQGQWLVDGGLVNPVPVSLCHRLGANRVIAVNLNHDLLGRHLNRKPANKPTKEEDSPLLRAQFGGLDPLFSRLRDRDADHPGLFEVLFNTINIMQYQITRSRLAETPPDLLLSPSLGHVGMLEYHCAGEAIETGRQCVLRARHEIFQKVVFSD